MKLNITSRFLNRIHEMVRTRRFGFVALRRKTFEIPRRIRLGPQNVELSHPHDLGAKEDFLTCLADDVYGLATMKSNPGTILDIGANVGFFALAARGYFPEAIIHAYEPNPRVLSYLGNHASAAGFQFFPEAVGAEESWVSMIDEADSNQAHTSAVDSSMEAAIKQVALDAIIERLGGHVDLMKMDCEGAEWDIFKAENAWKNIKEVRMEYHLTQGRTISDVQAALAAISFQITRQTEQEGFGIIWATNSRFGSK